MKIIKVIFACSLVALTACSSSSNGNGGNNNSNKEEENIKKELFSDAKKDSLFNLGKNTGYEIKGTITENEKVTHYNAAMKGNIVYFHYEEKSGGGWNYMVCELSSDGNSCSTCTYLSDLTPFGGSQQRDAEAFKLNFETSVEQFYEASKPAIYENSKYAGNETVLDTNTYKFDYLSDLGTVKQKITSYVEGEYGLTLKIVTEYLNGEERSYYKEMSVTSFKTGNDVVVPNFNAQ